MLIKNKWKLFRVVSFRIIKVNIVLVSECSPNFNFINLVIVVSIVTDETSASVEYFFKHSRRTKQLPGGTLV